jgi:tetratricopeptide (TPR) repeat protein
MPFDNRKFDMNDLDYAMAQGERHVQAGNLDDAQAVFENILKLNPEHYEAMNDLGTVFFLKGDIPSAENYYLKTYSLKNRNDDVLLNLTDLYISAKRWEDALRFLEIYLAGTSNDFVRINQLALIHMESGRTREAMPLLERSLQIQPDQPSIKDTLKTLKSKVDVVPASSIICARAIKPLRFSVCLIESEGYRFAHFLYDLCKYICFTFESAGYDCCIQKNRVSNDRINILVGGHRLDDPKSVKEIADSGKYIIVQSEILGEDTINNWPLQERYAKVYLPLIKQATVVWDGIDSNHIHLKKFGIDAVFLRFGYLPQMEEIIHKKNKDIDFLYYGSVTPHRKKMLDALAAKGGRIYVDFDSTAMYRNDLISRTRVNLAPKQAPDADHFSGTRILYLLNNRSIVVVERCKGQEYLEGCFPSADTEDYVDLCMDMLRRPDLDQLTGEYFERFKKINIVDEIYPLIDRLG